MSTDAEWEKWAQRDPYFAVVTHPTFRTEAFDTEARRQFFELGERDVDAVLASAFRYFGEEPSLARVLDFGCGTGRAVVSLAKRAERVVGMDVAPTMLAEARRNCEAEGLDNVDLLQSDDELSSLSGSFTFIYSFIVFQHIPVERGERLFKALLAHLEPGGHAAIHVTFAKTALWETGGVAADGSVAEAEGVRSSIARAVDALGAAGSLLVERYVHLAGKVRKRGEGGTDDTSRDPEMQMNSYNLNRLLFSAHQAGIVEVHCEITDHGGEIGAILFMAAPQT